MHDVRRPPMEGRSRGTLHGGGPRREGPSRLPRPRLTALGVGVLAILLMLLLGAMDALLLDAHRAGYGVCFLMVCGAMACWVRPADLYAAPVAAPLAFTAGLLFVTPGGGGFDGLVMGLFTGLSLQAMWVYGGTLLAGVIVLVRRVLYVLRRRAARAAAAEAGGRVSPGGVRGPARPRGARAG